MADTSFNTVTGNITINGNVLGDAFYPGVISFLGGGYYGYQTLGVGNITPYQTYQVGVGSGPSGVRVSYDVITKSYTWTSNYNSNIGAYWISPEPASLGVHLPSGEVYRRLLVQAPVRCRDRMQGLSCARSAEKRGAKEVGGNQVPRYL